MTYPAGVQTSRLTFSNPKTHGGKDADRTEITVQPTASIVWAETGEPLDDFQETVSPSPGMPGFFTAPFVDQPGVRDQAGNAFTMWAYIVTRRSWLGGVEGRPVRKTWQPLLGQSEIDFDTLPGGSMGLPVSVQIPPVTSVAGLTSAVGAAALAGALVPHLPNDVTPESVAAALPGYLGKTELNSTYAPASQATPQLLPKFRQKLATVRNGGGNMKLLCVGDSTTSGWGSSNAPTTANTNSWPNRLSGLLNSYVAPSAVGGIIPISTLAGGFDARWTLGTGWSRDNYGWGNGGMYTASAPAGALVCTPGVLADKYDVYYVRQPGGGDLSITATGTAAVPVTSNGGTSVQKVTVTAATASTTNTVSITATGALVEILMVEPYLSTTSKILVANAGVAASTLEGWIVNQNIPWNATGAIKAYAPDLTIINLGINDATNNAPVSTIQANMTTLVNAAKVSGDVIIATMAPSSQAPNAANEALYVPALAALAASLNVGFIDVYNRWGGTAVPAFMADGLHPNDLGYWDYADAVFTALQKI